MSRTLHCYLLAGVVSAVAVVPAWAQSAAPAGLVGPATAGKGAERLVAELPEERTRFSRSYVTASGLRVARVFGAPVNFKRDGSWRGIDSSLRRSGDELVSGENALRTRLPVRLGMAPVRLEQGSRWVEFGLRDVAPVEAKLDGSEATYAGALPGVDVVYRSQPEGVREVLRLADAKATSAYSFVFAASPGLELSLEAGGLLVVRDGDEVVFSVAAPTMRDAAGAESADFEQVLRREGDGWVLDLEPDSQWLASAKRRFPVEVDPDFSVRDTSVVDCHLISEQPDQSFCGADGLVVGDGNGGGQRHALVRYDIRGVIKPGQEVISAGAFLHQRAQTTNNQRTITPVRVTQDWTTAATWNRRTATTSWTTAGGTTDPAETGRAYGPIGFAQPPGLRVWDVTDLVRDWVRGCRQVGSACQSRPDFGFLLKDDQSTVNELTFSSSEALDVNQRPFMDLLITDALGQRAGYQLESQQLTDRMSLAVNAATGNLLIRESDLVVPGGLGPDLTVARSYNSGATNVLDSAPMFGPGWVSNYGDFRISGNGFDVFVRGPSGSVVRYARKPDGSFQTPAGFNTTLTQNASGFVLTENESQSKSTFSSSANNRLTQQEDRFGRRIRMEYAGPAGTLSKVVDSQQRETNFVYRPDGLPEKMVDPAGRQHLYAYTVVAGATRLTSYTDPAAGLTRFEYDTVGRIFRILTPGNRQTRIVYYGAGVNVGRVQSVQRVTATRTLCDGVDIGGATCTGTQTTVFDGPTTAYEYTVGYNGSTGIVTDPIGVSTPSTTDRRTTFTFDADERITKVVDALGQQQENGYDVFGNVNMYTPIGAQQAAARSTYGTGINRLEGVEQDIDDSGGAPLSTGLNYRPGSGTGPADYLPMSSDDAQGNRTMFENVGLSSGSPEQIELRSIKTFARSSPTTMVGGVRFEYDAPGRIRFSFDGKDNKTQYDWSAAGKLLKITPPLSLTDTTPGLPDATRARTFTYAAGADDALNRVTSVDEPDNRDVAFQYDSLDRLTRITYAGTNNFVGFTYDADGNLTAREDSGSVTTYRYDQLNRADQEVYPGSYINTYAYDLSGNLTTVTEPSGTTSYTYDQINRQASITQPGVAAPTTFSYTLNPPGLSEQATTTFPNGVKRREDYDRAGRMTLSCAWNGSPTSCPATPSQRLLSFSYTYTANPTGCPEAPGRELISAITERDGKNTAYCYDELGRLTDATIRNSAQTITGDYGYDYDPAGNILRADVQNPGSAASVRRYSFNGANQLCRLTIDAAMPANPCNPATVGGAAYTYDKTGNETTGFNRVSSVYNARNQLTTLTDFFSPTTLGYAGPGQAERNSFQRPNNPVFVSRFSLLGLAKYFNVDYTRDEAGRNLAQNENGTRKWFLTDHLGSTRALTNTAGNVSDRIDYEPYGQATPDTNASTILYAGGQRLPVAGGLYQYGERYYAPELARWTQPDPLLQPESLGEASSYSYVGGEPIGSIDSTGSLGCSTVGLGGACKQVKKGGKAVLNRIGEQGDEIKRGVKKGLKLFDRVPAAKECGEALAGESGKACDPFRFFGFEVEPAY